MCATQYWLFGPKDPQVWIKNSIRYQHLMTCFIQQVFGIEQKPNLSKLMTFKKHFLNVHVTLITQSWLMRNTTHETLVVIFGCKFHMTNIILSLMVSLKFVLSLLMCARLFTERYRLSRCECSHRYGDSSSAWCGRPFGQNDGCSNLWSSVWGSSSLIPKCLGWSFPFSHPAGSGVVFQ